MKLVLTLTLLLSSLNALSAEETTLIEVKKKAHQVHHIIMGVTPIVTTITCSITEDSKALVKYEAPMGRPPVLNEIKIKEKDMSRLRVIAESVAENSDEKFYLHDRDFTGYKTDETDSRYLKEDDAYLYHNGDKVHFYSLRRRLSRLYNGPNAIELRDLISKYCNLYL